MRAESGPSPRPPRAPRTGPRTARSDGNGDGAGQAAPPDDRLDHRELLGALTRLRKGDFRVRLAPQGSGVEARIADAFNDLVELPNA